MWLFFAFLSALSWALGRVILKPAYRIFSAAIIYTLNGLSFFLIWVFYALLSSSALIIPHGIIFFLPFLPPLAFVAFIFALNKGDVSVISALSSASIFISALLAVIFLKELVIALALLGLTERGARKKDKRLAFLMGLISALLFGVTNFTSKFAINQSNAVSFSLINGAFMIFLGYLWSVFSHSFRYQEFKQNLKTADGIKGLIRATIFSFGSFFFFLALQTGPVALIAVIGQLSLPLTMVLAALILKEKLSPFKKFLIILLFIAAVILSL